ncbi:MAG: hypothetical protein FJZ97_08685 [Chloroflexi bacterium]|nr:hypothetical protein [Chloroflexota bacterium]
MTPLSDDIATARPDLGLAVRQSIYDGFLAEGRSLSAAEIAGRLGTGVGEVRQELKKLAQAHALVLQAESGEVLMANPFSAVPTALPVTSQGRSWWGNCIWDALGILAMVGADGDVATACPDCGEALSLSIRAGTLSGGPAIAHFFVPVRSWWEDIVFT